MLTAILSSFNELHNEVFWRNLELLKNAPNVEILIVDGGSSDGTEEKLRTDFHVLPKSLRGERYNFAILRAKGEKILLVHPRSLLSRAVLNELSQLDEKCSWGAFRHSFDWSHPVLRFTSWYSNFVRGRGRGIYYLDHCLYFTADLRESARFPDVALFEDTLFCINLRQQVRPRLMKTTVVTSAVRFRRNGILRQSVMNQILKLLFHLGVSEKFMNRVYERGLSLNNKD